METNTSTRSACFAVSVVVPMFNVEKYVGECLDSLLLQTFQDFEVIVVDDCSTDNSVSVVEGYKEKFEGRLKLAKLEANSGSGAKPRNRGLDLSNGEYIFFADADDFMLLDTLETLYNEAKKNDADVVYTAAHYLMKQPNDARLLIDGEGKKLLAEGLEDKPTLIVNDIKTNLDKLFSDGNFHGPCTKLVRRELLIKNEIYFPHLPSGEDFLWVINVYCHAKRFLRLPRPFHFYRNYNENSITQTKRTPQEQLSRWINVFVNWIKAFEELAEENEILQSDPSYSYEALNSELRWCLERAHAGVKPLNNRETYEVLYQEFVKQTDSFLFTVPFFLTTIELARKARAEHLRIIDSLKRDVEQLAHYSISVIIPMFNVADYISECLDSLLEQTITDFEVIVVDDCSTDNSVALVESYVQAFDGRLKLLKTERNSGGSGVPRNKGLSVAKGEYVYFIDADDALTKTALEEMYFLAEENTADVVYCERYYTSTGVAHEFKSKARPATGRMIQKPPFVDKPTLESDDLSVRFSKWFKQNYWLSPTIEFIRRDLLVENDIRFPELVGSSDVDFAFKVLFCSKRFLRVPNAYYIKRIYTGSESSRKLTAGEHVQRSLNRTIRGLKDMDAFMERFAFFKDNPKNRYEVLDRFINTDFVALTEKCGITSRIAMYNALREKFGAFLGDYDVMIAGLCTSLHNKYQQVNNSKKLLQEAQQHIATLEKEIKQLKGKE